MISLMDFNDCDVQARTLDDIVRNVEFDRQRCQRYNIVVKLCSCDIAFNHGQCNTMVHKVAGTKFYFQIYSILIRELSKLCLQVLWCVI